MYLILTYFYEFYLSVKVKSTYNNNNFTICNAYTTDTDKLNVKSLKFSKFLF